MNPKDEIKEKLSILDVVSTYVKVEKSGSQYRARCPFHNERTPSFYVSPERKTYHCFGCGEHGDIFSFVEKLENIPFYEALKLLADRAQVKLRPSNENKKESRLISLLSDATDFYEKCLEESGEGGEYISSRGLLPQTIKKFHLGFAKDEWRSVFVYLMGKGYDPEEMEAAGLVIKTEKGYYDRFRGRIMFPIRNISGATVGFSGRILPKLVDPTKEQGKYVNSPETALYHKSKILFGYDTAKKKMSEKKYCVVVEGQMDLCMSYQAGIENTIAVSGTAFTDEHISLIKRFAEKVILSFDKDQAGLAALRKSALTCLHGGLDVYVIKDIGAKDPADLIKDNKEAWVKAVEEPVHVIEYFLDQILKEEKDERAQGKRIVSELMPYLRALKSSIDRTYFIKKISKESHIGEENLIEEVKKGGVITPEAASVSSDVNPVPHREKIERELVALVTWKKWKENKKVKDLFLPYVEYPDAIVEETIFELEKTMHGDPEKMLDALISSYRKEMFKEKLATLQGRLRKEVENEELILKEINELVKLHKDPS